MAIRIFSAVSGYVNCGLDNYVFAIENSVYSNVSIDILRLVCQMDNIDIRSAVAGGYMSLFKSRIITQAMVNGLNCDKVRFDTGDSDSGVNVLSGTFLDGSPDLQPESAPSAGTLWQQFTSKRVTAVEQQYSVDIFLSPENASSVRLKLYPGQTLVVQSIQGTGANQAGGGIAFFNAVWSEDDSFVNPYKIEGITKDNTGAALGSCDVYLLKKVGDEFISIRKTTSDPTTGDYIFRLSDNTATYAVTARKTGSPNVFDVTDFNITPTVI
jgi:hypothetical protein